MMYQIIRYWDITGHFLLNDVGIARLFRHHRVSGSQMMYQIIRFSNIIGDSQKK
ncbi:hypothetical protein [Bacillus salacetis]|uniref:hypothetical protein n=1 Tax=Bacillus salacetis TaxID=2315464 RepID=UPI001443B7B7|nr:hypothetical protein [Bacillus salacetis]